MPDDHTTTIHSTGTVAVGGSATGEIEAAGDRDWFAVELEAGRTYRIDLRGSPTGDGTLADTFLRRILDSEGNKTTGDGSGRTYNDNHGGTVNSRVTFTATESGTHYIEASGDRDETGTYTLSVADVTPQAPADGDPPPDGARADAVDLGDITGLEAPRFPAHSLDGEAGSAAWFRFTLGEAKRVGLGLRRQDADADLVLEDGDGNELQRSAAAGTANEWIAATLLAGTYWLRVEAREAGANAYLLRHGVSAPDPGEVARLEAERDAGTADPRPPAFGAASYAFDLAENADGSVERVSLGTVSATDPDGDAVRYGIAGGNGAGLFGIDAATGELSYVGAGEDRESGMTSHELTVRASDGTLHADVLVTVTVTDVEEGTDARPPAAAGSVPEPAGTDFAADRTTAGRVAAGESVTGEVAEAGDVDWYAVELEAGTAYRFDLEGFLGGGGTLWDPYLHGIHDGDGNLIAGTRNDGQGRNPDSRVDFTPGAGGTHYVAAGAAGAYTGTYRLSVTEAVPEIRVADAEAHEEDGALRFRVTLDRAAAGAVTVRYATSDGTAVAGQDYEAASGTLAFAPGETVLRVEVALVDDSVEDSGETLTLTLSDAVGGRIADATAVGTILNSEPVATVPEGEDDLSADTATAGGVAVGESATGDIAARGDVDWFAVTLEAGKAYRVDLEGAQTGAGTLSDPYLRGIHDSDGNLVDGTADDDSGAGRNSVKHFAPESAGTHYVAAGGFGAATGTYRVSVTEVADEHSADTDTAGTVAVGGSATGVIGAAGDVDWFAVTLEAGREYRIDIEGYWTNRGTLRDPYLRGIHDAQGDLIEGTAADAGGISDNPRLRFEPEASGTHYVAVGGDTGARGDTGTYRLSVRDTTAAGDGEIAESVSEPEGEDLSAGVGTAGRVAVGGSATGEVSVDWDRDWFAVTLEAGKRYRFDLEGSSTGAGTLRDPYLWGVHDQDGRSLGGFVGGGGAGLNARLHFVAETSGTHYVGAGGDTGVGTLGGIVTWTGTYRLSVTELADDYAGDAGTAGTVAVGASVRGEIEIPADRDWFAVTLEAGTRYQFDIEGWNAGAGTLILPRLDGVHDGDGTRVARPEGVNMSHLIHTPETGGTHYVSASGNGHQVGTYRLSVKEAGADIPAGTGTTAKVAVGGSVRSVIESPDDRDWFAVELEAGTTYVIDLEGWHASAGSLHNPELLGIRDSDGKRIEGTSNQNGGAEHDDRVVFTPGTGGTHYIEAGSWLTGIGTYRLSVREADPDIPAGTGTAATVAAGGSATGVIERAGDSDWFAVTFEAGRTYRIDLEGSPTSAGTLGDPWLRGIHDGDGDLIEGTANDDGGLGRNSRLTFEADSDGTHYIAAGAAGSGTGTYELSVEEVL